MNSTLKNSLIYISIIMLILSLGLTKDLYSITKWIALILVMIVGYKAFFTKNYCTYYFSWLMTFSFYCLLLDFTSNHTDFASLSLFNTFILAYLFSFSINSRTVLLTSFFCISISCFLMEVYFLFKGIEASVGNEFGRNANAVGQTLYLGAISLFVLIVFVKNKFYKLLFVAGLLFFYYFSLYLGSRQTFIIPTVFIISYIFFKYIKCNIRNILTLTLVFIFLLFIFQFVFNHFAETRLFTRMFESEDISRINLIDFAYEKFKENPIFGYGIGTFRHYEGYYAYTHNTTMELLFCSGLIGLTLYYLPLLTIGIKQWKLGRFFQNKADVKTLLDNQALSLSFVIAIIIGAQFSILFYSPIANILLFIMIKIGYIYKENEIVFRKRM